MSTTVMPERVIEASPKLQARVAGGLWLTCIVMGIFGFVAGSSVIVAGDAAATATNILANESLFRLGFASDLISGLSYVGVTALLYYLLKPAGRSLALIAAFFGLAGVAIGGAGNLTQLAPLVLLHGDHYLSAFTTGQLQAMAMIALKLRVQLFTRRAAGHGRGKLRDRLFRNLPGAGARRAPCAFHHAHRAGRGGSAHRVAAREGRERSTVEGAGQHSGLGRHGRQRWLPKARRHLCEIPFTARAPSLSGHGMSCGRGNVSRTVQAVESDFDHRNTLVLLVED